MNMMTDKAREEDRAEEDEDFAIEYEEDDQPPPKGEEGEKPKRREARSEDADDDDHGEDDEDDDERVQYSKRVQKRIDKLTYNFNEEKRRAEEAQRLQEEAVSYAKQMHDELQRARRQLQDGEGVLYQQAEGRLQAQIDNAKYKLRQAHESADPDQIVEAQTELSNLVAQKARIESFKPQKRSAEQNEEKEFSIPQSRQKQQPQRPQPSEKALRWKEQNEWFDSDQKMTAVAYAVHNDLVNKGVQPDSDEYYGQIDREMRKTFPSYFAEDDDASGGDEGKGNVVAAPSRKAGKKPRTVRLSKTQLSFCKRLGITPEQYVKEMMKQEKN